MKTDISRVIELYDRLKDYNFEGSVINSVLDVLAYTTHYNAFNANMAVNESFLDTSQLRSSAVSHAKLLGYTPRSYRSSRATVKITPANTDYMERGSEFSSITVDGEDYPFIVKTDVPASGNEFDKVEFEKKNNWEVSIKSYPSTNDFTSGTEIIISDLLFTPTCKKSDRLNEYLAERYKAFINSGEIEIFVEGYKCIPQKNNYIMEEPISITTEKDDIITGVLRIQTKRSQKHQEYGFDLYKNKRIIKVNDKIGVGIHGERALICGELNFDFCDVNFTKNLFLEQSDKYKAAAKALKEYLNPLRPLFTTKCLKRDKIEKLLEIQKETGNIPNLAEFKELVKSLDNDGEMLISETVYASDIEKMDSEKPATISKHTELLSQISSHLSYLEETSRIITECKTDEEAINEINSNSMTEMKLSSYSNSLIDLANKIQLLLGKANLQQLASGSNTANVNI